MPDKTDIHPLILASSSPYRKLLLERLGLPFTTVSPQVDESPSAGESPEALVARLATAKAMAVAGSQPAAVVIGSDQVAVYDGGILGKPGSPDRARRQLAAFSGKTVRFLSAVSVRCLETDFRFDRIVATEVAFRELAEAEIARYVERDRPLDCAGGFRSEATGSALLRAMDSSDPTAIIGLPLITVAEALREAGFTVP